MRSVERMAVDRAVPPMREGRKVKGEPIETISQLACKRPCRLGVYAARRTKTGRAAAHPPTSQGQGAGEELERRLPSRWVVRARQPFLFAVSFSPRCDQPRARSKLPGNSPHALVFTKGYGGDVVMFGTMFSRAICGFEITNKRGSTKNYC